MLTHFIFSDKNRTLPTNHSKVDESISALKQRCADLENRLIAHQSHSAPNQSGYNLAEMKNNLNRLSSDVQRLNYFQGILSEWRKNIDNQVCNNKLISITPINIFNNSFSNDKLQQNIFHGYL